MSTKYPDVTVELTGQDGNAMMIMALTQKAMRRAGVPQEELDAYFKEARSGDYTNVLVTTMNWVNVE